MTENGQELSWSQEDLLELPLISQIQSPFRGKFSPSSVGKFRLVEEAPDIATGWDIVGAWDVLKSNGIIILKIGLESSEYVTDLAPEGWARPRQSSEVPTKGVTSAELRRMRMDVVLSSIHKFAEEFLTSPFLRVEEDQELSGAAKNLVSDLKATSRSYSGKGRPSTDWDELVQWTDDVLEVLTDVGLPLYATLAGRWHVAKTTVRNHRLPKLRKIGLLSGAGRNMVRGPNYPRKEIDDGEDS